MPKRGACCPPHDPPATFSKDRQNQNVIEAFEQQVADRNYSSLGNNSQYNIEPRDIVLRPVKRQPYCKSANYREIMARHRQAQMEADLVARDKMQERADALAVRRLNILERQAHFLERIDANIECKSGMCLICNENPPDCAIIPCGHVTACKECMDQYGKVSNECPFCRTHYTAVIKIYGGSGGT